MHRNYLSTLIHGLLVLWVLSFAEPTAAATYYVRASGSDDNDGLSPARAFATITRGASVAGEGVSVIVGPGRYAEGDIRPRGTGRRVEPILFLADRLGKFTGDEPGNVIVDASGFENGFKLSGERQWVIVNGFTVTAADQDGVFVKDLSDSCVITNCVVFSNGGRGIFVRDSADVVVFNNLVYANGGTGIEFEGEGEPERPEEASPRGIVINNTVYGNGVDVYAASFDGLRIEGAPPSEEMTVLHNVIADNRGIGVNLKEGSKTGFVGQWNLVNGNGAGGYKTLDVARGSLDFSSGPLLVQPAGLDNALGGSGYQDDDFRLAQASTGDGEESPAVDASAIKAKVLGLQHASTGGDGVRDRGAVDLGFHSGNTTDFVSKLRKIKRELVCRVQKSFPKRVRRLRDEAMRCEEKVATARVQWRSGRGPCLEKSSRVRLARRCGSAVYDVCQP